MSKSILGIGGGVGPMAGVKLQEYIVNNTQASGDPDHPMTVHVSAPELISDRTRFLLEGGENPAHGMIRVLNATRASVIELGGNRMIFGVPCNTFHAPKIFDEFRRLVAELPKEGPEVKLIHMIDETAKYLEIHHPNAKKIGLMSTTGTRETRVYHDVLEKEDREIIEVPEEIQDELHNTIYNPDWGIKAVSPVTQKAQENFKAYAQMLKDQGAELIILGCTEIPLALPETDFEGIPLVDPMRVLAQAMIQEADPTKLKAA